MLTPIQQHEQRAGAGGGGGGGAVVVLNWINNLRDASYLFLHSLTETESSPLANFRQNVLIILTMTIQEMFKEMSDCETKIIRLNFFKK